MPISKTFSPPQDNRQYQPRDSNTSLCQIVADILNLCQVFDDFECKSNRALLFRSVTSASGYIRSQSCGLHIKCTITQGPTCRFKSNRRFRQHSRTGGQTYQSSYKQWDEKPNLCSSHSLCLDFGVNFVAQPQAHAILWLCLASCQICQRSSSVKRLSYQSASSRKWFPALDFEIVSLLVHWKSL